MRPKINFRTASKENYLEFCKKNSSIDLTFEQYKSIIYTYNELLVKVLLETGDAIKLPFGLGTLVINKYKPTKYRIDKNGVEKVNLPIDWQETKKQGKYIYLLNTHTEGYKYYFMWNYWKARMRMSYIWKFEMARVNSRLLNSYLKKHNSPYRDIYLEHPRKK